APKVTLAGWVVVPCEGELTGWEAATHQEYLAILLVVCSVNQRLLSGPVTISCGPLLAVRASSGKVPEGVTWPSLLALFSRSQRLPSGPVVMPAGLLEAVGTENSVMVPTSVMRPMRLPLLSVNQRLPSGPTVISQGPELAFCKLYSVKVP